MNSLDRKRWRDFWHLRGQVVAITLVVASGVAIAIMSLSTLYSLRQTRSLYYQQNRFAEVFAELKRAPESLRRRLAAIPGMGIVETRVVAAASLRIAGCDEPVTGQLIAIPEQRDVWLNRLTVRHGRLVEPDRDDEVVISESFARAHRFSPGDTLTVIINGRQQNLEIVGIALSPEFVYEAKPGSLLPDYKRFGILWLGRKALENAYDMEGAFNNVVATLGSGAVIGSVVDRLDQLLEPYGGQGAYGRAEQLSHRYLSEEFRQLEQMATIYPTIFLGVAAFLLHVVISRLVHTERQQIAILKAFGYQNGVIGLHYFRLVMMIVLVGVACGVAVGVWLGRHLSELYMEYYRFPFLSYTVSPGVVAAVAAVTVLAAALGTVWSVSGAVRLPPAVAMRPAPPAVYRPSWLERLGLQRFFSQPARMVIRHLERQPLRSGLTIIGIAMAGAILMVGSIFQNSIEYLVDVHFGLAHREDLTVAFVEPTASRSLYELQRYPGVIWGEVYRTVPVRLRSRHRQYRTAVMGVRPENELHRLLDRDLQPFQPSPAGIMLTDQLGSILQVKEGDRLTVEALEGRRPVRELTVAGLVKEYVGVSAYMELAALNRFMAEGELVSGVYLRVDEDRLPAVYAALNTMPRVAGTVVQRHAVESFYETMAEQVLIFTFFVTMFAGIIAFGVVYNSARISLAERGRELASLRVLGFSRREISAILLGELAILTLAAIPLGFLAGYGLCFYIISYLQTDLYRIPLVIDGSTYAFSAVMVLLAAGISGLLVRRRLDHLDLIAVLKTRE
ncbi:MAG: FtsX-like permease family protein [Deltaproteobacteria bacterium]|nr:FtsX-like permease family protein [Candidatus Anaeroferrophillus wilburensis]MBN2889116.1 FtsX-like permease family protein [Deltaproteobacteria bacterium]